MMKITLVFSSEPCRPGLVAATAQKHEHKHTSTRSISFIAALNATEESSVDSLAASWTAWHPLLSWPQVAQEVAN